MATELATFQFDHKAITAMSLAVFATFCKLEQWAREMWPELTQDVPRVEETSHLQKGIFILAERREENPQMAKVNTTHTVL